MSVNMFFKCECCNNVDSISVTRQPVGIGFRCYRCLNNSWHGLFPEEKYNPEVHKCINTDNSRSTPFGEESFS